MSEFSCPATFECRRICDALNTQGIEAGFSETDGCKAPQHFFERDGIVGVEIPDDLPSQNLKLTTALFEALSPLVQEKESHSADIAPIVDSYQSILDSRTNLWTAMGAATKAGRQFTDVELDYYRSDIEGAQRLGANASGEFSSEDFLRAQASFDHRTLKEHRVVFDEQAIDVLDRLAVNAMDGKSTLLVGDKGIAKTQLALFMARFIAGGSEPVFLSGHGDQTADEFIGRDRQDPKTGQFVFKPGKLVNAMRLGLPVVIDEINLADQAITMRLQDILLRKPGDTFVLQENGDEVITIAPGFVVFATANEASERYRHRVTLDPAFRDRFDVLNVVYPDSDNDNPMLGTPTTTYRLAFAAASSEDGSISEYIDPNELEMIVRLAHVTQRLYSQPLMDAQVSSLGLDTSTSQYLSADKPVMTDCITPRSMVSILQRCAPGNKIGVTLRGEITKAIKALDQGGSTNNSMYAHKILEFYESKMV
ncbi:MAG: AAA family ATPase [Patescibacteria group bacterium]